MSQKIILQHHITPCGEMLLASYDEKLCLCDWLTNPHRNYNDNRVKTSLSSDFVKYESPVISEAVMQLNEFFAGDRHEFDLPLLIIGSDFQKLVWQTLSMIPYGKTTAYKDIATMIGKVQSTRAVANAIGYNPLSIVIPCHRVIGIDGSLTGYAGGIEAKYHLLSLEQNCIRR